MLASALMQCTAAGITPQHQQRGNTLLLALPNTTIASNGTGEFKFNYTLPVMATTEKGN